jgi:Glycosyl hydrolase family 99
MSSAQLSTSSKPQCRMARSQFGWASALLAVVLLLAIYTPVRAQSAPPSPAQQPIPVLAYYYIWFDPGSWDRAKVDYPLLGHYSSDDKKVMQEHVRLAKKAGIDGFIVSWKSTDVLNRRLAQLIEVADAEDFKLAIIYQGLDFDRNPLPVNRVAQDLDYFIATYATDKAFTMFDQPLVIWSGTWKFKPTDIAKVAGTRHDQLLILATERNLDGYQHLADFVSGNAYYWSSVDPETFPGYPDKLIGIGEAVHAHHGLWIAPAAPGFDARMIGGSRIVDRKDGATLRQQMDAALQSSPDAVGLISWNEFSENSYVEPSIKYGSRYLEVLADIRGTVFPKISDFDSSEPGTTTVRPDNLILLGALVLLVLASLLIIVRRNSRLDQIKTFSMSQGDDTSLS